MQICRILDDQYGEKIYKEIRHLFHDWNYPVTKNIQTPLEFVNKIQDWDIILLDNYFPWKWWEEALGDDFLWELMQKKKKVRIVCISDYGEKLLERYDNWGKAYQGWLIFGFVKSKDGFEIGEILIPYCNN